MIKRKILCVLLSVGLVFTNNSLAYASISSYSEDQLTEVKSHYLNKNFLVLGDSIGTGYLLPSHDYSYGMKLSQKLNMNYTNIAVNGTTSSGLLEHLSEDDYINKVKEADIINISIGGNDIMLPVLGIIRRLIQGDTEVGNDYSEKSSMERYEIAYNEILSGKYDDMINSDASYGLRSFKENFPKVLEKIKQINPNCKILLQTIYDPLTDVNMFKHVFDLVDPYITEINSFIINSGKENNLFISDVATFMKNESGVNVSNISSMDIHPNKYGHNAIYLSLYKTLTSEYPNDIAFNLNNAKCTLEYSNDSLSPTVFIYTDKGYRAPMYLEIKYDNLRGVCKTEKISDGLYKAILPSRCLYGDITVSGTSVKLSETNNQLDEGNNSFNGDVNKAEATETVNNDNINSSKNIGTYDYLYKFLFAFLLALMYLFIRIKGIRFRKE